jgi:hypothetical protein
MGTNVANNELISIGRGLGDSARADRAACAAGVLDYHLLAKNLGQSQSDYPACYVAWATGSEWNNQG